MTSVAPRATAFRRSAFRASKFSRSCSGVGVWSVPASCTPCVRALAPACVPAPACVSSGAWALREFLAGFSGREFLDEFIECEFLDGVPVGEFFRRNGLREFLTNFRVPLVPSVPGVEQVEQMEQGREFLAHSELLDDAPAFRPAVPESEVIRQVVAQLAYVVIDYRITPAGKAGYVGGPYIQGVEGEEIEDCPSCHYVGRPAFGKYVGQSHGRADFVSEALQVLCSCRLHFPQM